LKFWFAQWFALVWLPTQLLDLWLKALSSDDVLDAPSLRASKAFGFH